MVERVDRYTGSMKIDVPMQDESSIILRLVGIIITIVVMIVAIYVARRLVYVLTVSALTKQHYPDKKERRQRIDTLTKVFNRIIALIIGLIALVIILTQLGVDVVALIAGIGALGVVIGLAGQSMFKEIYRGISLLLFDQMRVGDIVQVAGCSGVVESVSLLITRLRDMDGQLHHVPNSEITTVTNMSQNFANVNFDIRVAHDTDIDQAEKIMNELGQELVKDEVMASLILEPIEFLRVDSIDGVGINLKAIGRVRPGEQWGVAAVYRRRLIALLREAGIVIPKTQLELRN